MLNGNCEAVWATLEAWSIFELAFVHWEYNRLTKENTAMLMWISEQRTAWNPHYAHWMVLSISMKYFCFVEMLQSFLQPHPFANATSFMQGTPGYLWWQETEQRRTTTLGGCEKQIQIIQTYANNIIKMHSKSVMEMICQWANTHLSRLDFCHIPPAGSAWSQHRCLCACSLCSPAPGYSAHGWW